VREVVEVAPHELRAEHAVRRGAEPERALEVLRVVGDSVERRVVGRRPELLGIAEDVADVGRAVVTEVPGGGARAAGSHARLEELLGPPRDARALQRLTEERGAAALGCADQVGRARHAYKA
jgi:hypothetical protein